MSAALQAELFRLKSYFPFRIVFAAVKDGKGECYAKVTHHTMNKLLRDGYEIFEATNRAD